MQRVIGIYGGAQAPKAVATVSPILSDSEADDEPDVLEAPTDRDVEDAHSPFRITHDVESGGSPELSLLQLKSSVRSHSRPPSNQDVDALSRPSTAALKYAVIGQKQQWRKARAERQRVSGDGSFARSTIQPVELSTPEASDGAKESSAPQQRERYGERASSYVSYRERTDSPLPSSRPASSQSSRESQLSSGRSSSSSTGRRSDSEASPRELFVVTQQKKSKYTAKLCLPGQSPLYLGRYRSEDAARAACENAFTTITTPR
ncbi:hypothetical protein PINS_up009237 [Pythium insidiosum]|nr:hypothetical protein PINS_up009237 [Pythium insidiosum]